MSLDSFLLKLVDQAVEIELTNETMIGDILNSVDPRTMTFKLSQVKMDLKEWEPIHLESIIVLGQYIIYISLPENLPLNRLLVPNEIVNRGEAVGRTKGENIIVEYNQ